MTRKMTMVAILFALLTIESSAKGNNKSFDAWFAGRQWQQGATCEPSVAIDKSEFAEHYAKFPQRWSVVFEFIKSNNLDSLPLGQRRLSDDVLVNVQQYDTRMMNKPETYEQHGKMIDLQYVVQGRELHGTVKKSAATIVEPYNDKKDIAQYSAPNVPYYIISSGQYSIFFPDDVHLTNIGYGSQTKVKKVVFKIKAQ